MLTVTLPYPLSANKYWRPVTLNGRAMIVPTKEAKAFKADIAWRLLDAGVRRPLAGRVQIHLDLYPARPKDWQARQRKLGACWDDNVMCIDIDNARKVLYDAFKGVLIVDDKWIWSDSATRREPDGEARVVVTITQITTEQPQGTLELPAPRADLFDPLEV
ncbi:MAG: RusA family crossover junction endodeoxyribonuclease [Paraburkholderia tropica]|nr:RusA family crossover junction endodeoxyribonuclease [Paraburkholderia tropica]